MADFVCGANDAGHHLTGVNWGRDLPEPLVLDIRNAVIGDPSPDGKGVVDICRGIEVGHVFQLGTRYSEAMGCTYLDQQGKAQPMVMGCYGIGVTRLLGAAIEQGHDERGIIWPISMAPFEVVICPMGYEKSEPVKAACDQLHKELVAAGVDVILDDRNERPGAMFADWELIGAPFRVVIGDRGLADSQVEFKGRTDAESQNIPLTQIKDKVIAAVQAAKSLVN
jgi:prolyl-tRNA synthetase